MMPPSVLVCGAVMMATMLFVLFALCARTAKAE